MTTNPTVLVLLAAYNGEAFIGTQVASILHQEAITVEVLIRLDPSTDDSQRVIDDLQRRSANVHQLRSNAEQRPRGAAANFYKLIAEANVPENVAYVALADQDDFWYPNKLEGAVAKIEQHGVAAYSSDVDAWNEKSDSRVRIVKSQPQRRWDHLFSSAGPGCTYVLKRETFFALQKWIQSRFDEIQDIEYHDWLIYAWARTNRYEWYIDSQSTLAYRQHAANQLGANRGLAAAAKRLVSMRDGWYLQQAQMIITVLRVNYGLPAHALANPSLVNRMRLAVHASQLRRSRKDQFGIALTSLISPICSLTGAEAIETSMSEGPT
ncbi:glycosyltransferase [Knoellia sp. CPCC 206435]|uniref:glycosyltransferase n=1 Tax=Knoellia terrae TaxID=3404797 RepID=UPI003B43621C